MGKMNVAGKIARYAFRYWRRHNMEEWPTVRQAAKALGIRQSDIEDNCNDYEHYQLTRYFCIPAEPLADWCVEALTPEVDRAWAEYYGKDVTA